MLSGLPLNCSRTELNSWQTVSICCAYYLCVRMQEIDTESGQYEGMAESFLTEAAGGQSVSFPLARDDQS